MADPERQTRIPLLQWLCSRARSVAGVGRVGLLVALLAAISGCGDGGSDTEVGDSGRSGELGESEVSSGGVRYGGVGYRVVEVSDPGVVEGRVTLAGAVPDIADFDEATLEGVCVGAHENERLVLSADGGIVGAVVRLVDVDSGVGFPSRLTEVVVDQVGCRYLPRVVVAATGSDVLFRNSDPTPHNVRVEDESGSIVMNVAQPREGEEDRFAVTKVGPHRVGCDYHPWMNAVLFGTDHPYATLTDSTGAYSIDNIPPGTYRLEVWLDGVEPKPAFDQNGNLVRYRFSQPAVERRSVDVTADSKRVEDFTIDLQESL